MNLLKWIFCGAVGTIKWLTLMAFLIFTLISAFFMKLADYIVND